MGGLPEQPFGARRGVALLVLRGTSFLGSWFNQYSEVIEEPFRPCRLSVSQNAKIKNQNFGVSPAARRCFYSDVARRYFID